MKFSILLFLGLCLIQLYPAQSFAMAKLYFNRDATGSRPHTETTSQDRVELRNIESIKSAFENEAGNSAPFKAACGEVPGQRVTVWSRIDFEIFGNFEWGKSSSQSLICTNQCSPGESISRACNPATGRCDVVRCDSNGRRPAFSCGNNLIETGEDCEPNDPGRALCFPGESCSRITCNCE